MKKKMLVTLSCLLFCYSLILILSACTDDRSKEPPTSPTPPSVEIDDQDIESGADGEYNSDIVVTPKDPDMDIVVTPKDPDTNITINDGDETTTSAPTIEPSIDIDTEAKGDADVDIG